MSEPNKPAAKKPTVSKAAQENQELQKEIRELKKQNEEKEMKLANLDNQKAVQQSDETAAIIENLQRQIEEIKRGQASQPVYDRSGKKEKYSTPRPEDILDDAVTFTARCVTKVIPGYMDENGVEVLAPHKIIVLQYAASDIRQDGKEQDILNFCSYSTKLKKEIEFLREHPEYGITFGENMNEVAGHNPKDYEFRTKAAEQVASMSPESVIDFARMIKLNYHNKSNKQLKSAIVAHLVSEFQKEADGLQNDLKNRILEQALKVNT